MVLRFWDEWIRKLVKIILKKDKIKIKIKVCLKNILIFLVIISIFV